MVEIEDGKKTLFGNGVLQLNTNNIHKGLVALENMFDNWYHYKKKCKSTHEDDTESMKLRINENPKMVYIDKRLKKNEK